MRKLIASLMFVVIALLTQTNANAQTNSSLFRHVVIITFKHDAHADSIKALDDVYVGLSKNSLVKDFEIGVSESGRDTGVVKHVYVTSFASKEDLNSYKKISEYSQLFKLSLPVSEEVMVADYWAKESL